MNKTILAAALMTMFGLTGCAVTDRAGEAPAVAAAEAGPVKPRDQSVVTGSRIPGVRSSAVSAIDAADANRQMRDNATPFAFKQ